MAPIWGQSLQSVACAATASKLGPRGAWASSEWGVCRGGVGGQEGRRRSVCLLTLRWSTGPSVGFGSLCPLMPIPPGSQGLRGQRDEGGLRRLVVDLAEQVPARPLERRAPGPLGVHAAGGLARPPLLGGGVQGRRRGRHRDRGLGLGVSKGSALPALCVCSLGGLRGIDVGDVRRWGWREPRSDVRPFQALARNTHAPTAIQYAGRHGLARSR